MNTQNRRLILTAATLILAAAMARLLPHPPNFAPIAALGIFGGSVVKDKKLAFILPLGALLLSDLLFQFFTSTPGFYGLGQIYVYGAFMLITFLSTRMKKISAVNIVFACIWSGVLFFLISNFGDWVTRSFYPPTFSGLMSCYTAGIVFYKNDLFGSMLLNSFMANFFFSGLLFGSYALIKKSITAPASRLA
ncbi:MAG: DUF6580 family putative transport protein [Ferruginibacter sp.]